MGEKEKIVVVGYGWVGQANAIALITMGYDVYFFDTQEKLTFHYSASFPHEYAKVQRVSSIREVDSGNTWFIVCVGDRVSEEREQDISLIKKVTDSLKDVKGNVILRSTVLPQKLDELVFDLYMPEFLHEKNAIQECVDPFYFVLGLHTEVEMPSFMKDWERRSHKVFKGTPKEASYIKYLSNIWNTIRIAFVNEMGDSIATPKTSQDVKQIEKVLDFVLERKMYVRYGQGFDGHCLPKDTRAYIGAHLKEGKNMDMLIGAYTSNEHHKALQDKYQTLPKVFSFWDYNKMTKGLFTHAWKTMNDVPAVRKLRKNLRGVMDVVSGYIPNRSVQETKRIWEEKAKQNPHYYSNTRTKSGEAVTDEELKQTGLNDYERYIQGDAIVRDLLERNTQAVVLDFGCGVGRMTQFFAPQVGMVHGLDISDTMVEYARGQMPQIKNAVFTAFDGEVFPYEAGQFDFIFSYLTLQHAPTDADIVHYLKSFFMLLKEGGVAKIQVRGGRGIKKWEWSYGVSFTPERIITLAEEAGFSVLDHQVEGVKNIWLTLKK